jgi:hypothetical protein
MSAAEEKLARRGRPKLGCMRAKSRRAIRTAQKPYHNESTLRPSVRTGSALRKKLVRFRIHLPPITAYP